MDKDIQQRLLQAEDTLIDSISRDDNFESLMLFKSSWNSFYVDFSRCISAEELSDDTISLAHSVASRISLITSCFSDLHKTHDSLRNQLLDGVGSILDGLSRVTISPPSLTEQNTQSLEPSLPPFIEPAYKWLLANIHNPYPSSDTKASIASNSRCSMSSVAAWFISARRRIGWTTICRKHFNNCRAATVDAASRALVKEDSTRILEPAVFHDFQQMKAATQDLYASIFTKSALAGDLDAVVKDMTEEDRLRLEWEKKEHAQKEKKRHQEKEIRKIQRACDRQAQKTPTTFASYPSPSYSCTPSPVPTLEELWTDESEEEDDSIPPVLAGRKRRASVLSESLDSRQSSCADRPMKRLRVKTPTPFADPSALPSPPSSSGGLDGSDVVQIIAPEISSGSSRKRRLSDTDAHAAPKRPRGLHVGPRVHAVSDPLPKASVPLESNINDWFQTNFFEIPGPVKNVGFDQFAPVDIEVFDGYTFPDTQINCIEQPFQQNYTPHALVDLEAKLADVEVPPHDPIPSPDLGDLDNFNFFNAISTIAPNYSGEAVGSSTAIDTIFQPPVNLIDFFPSDPFSWTALLNSEQAFLTDINQFLLPSSCDDFTQLLPEIDLSALQLPPLSYPSPQPQPPPSPANCARLAKLGQLRRLREETRLLEQELAVSV